MDNLTQEFVEKAVAVHGSNYDYSNVVYVKSSQKVDIICPVHGLFQIAHWTHGGHWFDPLSRQDLDVVLFWKSKHSIYYDSAINTWTVRDVEKRETAIRNNLNYLVFWDSNLDDAKRWLKSFQ